jgi:hypothetical protein
MNVIVYKKAGCSGDANRRHRGPVTSWWSEVSSLKHSIDQASQRGYNKPHETEKPHE